MPVCSAGYSLVPLDHPAQKLEAILDSSTTYLRFLISDSTAYILILRIEEQETLLNNDFHLKLSWRDGYS